MSILKEVIERPEQYRKLWVAIGGGAVLLASELLGIESLFTKTLIEVLTAYGVYRAVNEKGTDV